MWLIPIPNRNLLESWKLRGTHHPQWKNPLYVSASLGLCNWLLDQLPTSLKPGNSIDIQSIYVGEPEERTMVGTNHLGFLGCKLKYWSYVYNIYIEILHMYYIRCLTLSYTDVYST